MKKALSLLLSCSLLTAALSGCGGGGTEPTQAASDDPSTWKVGVMLSGSPTDGGYCQQGADGVRAIEEKYGCQVAIIDSVTTADDARAEASLPSTSPKWLLTTPTPGSLPTAVP